MCEGGGSVCDLCVCEEGGREAPIVLLQSLLVT